MRLVLLAAAVLAAACGPQHCPDPDHCFQKIVQFSAVSRLQVVDNHVYFYEASGFERVPVSDGGIELLVNDQTVHDFAVVSGAAYVATDTGLIHVNTGSGGKSVLGSEKTVAVAADATGFVWQTCTALNIASLDGAGVHTVPLATCDQHPQLKIDGSTIYGTDDTGLWYASRSGGPINRYSNLQCSRMEPGGGWLYCVFNNNLLRVNPLEPDNVETVIQGSVHDFALSPQNIYAGVDTDLDAQPRSGGGAAIYGTIANITAVAVDNASCYLVNSDADMGLLMSTAL